MMMLRFTLNGEPQTLSVAADARLIDILRETLGQTDAKIGCAIGRCGTCMLLLDGAAVNGCLLMAWQAESRTIVTPQALDRLAEGRILREAMAIENAFQCGYCAPGFMVTLTALLIEDPDADEPAIRAALTGNLCRCTGYHSILRGAHLAVAMLKTQSTDEAGRTP